MKPLLATALVTAIVAATSLAAGSDTSAPARMDASGDWVVWTGLTATPPDRDRGWTTMPDSGEYEGVRWFAHELIVPDTPPVARWTVTIVGVDSAWDLWWDDQRVATNGVVAASADDEIPGTWARILDLPERLTQPGAHRVALRTSTSHGPSDWRRPRLIIRPADEFAAYRTQERSFHLISGGVFLTAAVFSLALFLGGGRQRPYLLFGLHLITCLATVVLGSVDVQTLVPAPIYRALLPAVRGMLSLGGVLLLAFFVRMFAVPRRHLHYLLAVLVSTVPYWIAGGRGVVLAVLAYAIGLMTWAIVRRQPGAIAAMVGILILSTGVLALHFDVPHAQYVNTAGLILFIFAISISTSRQLLRQNLDHEIARLRSARLEADLLRRSIQPHFLMNTLVSVLSWIRRDPETAGRLIQALADEFRQVNRIASATLIPLQREIELCQTHLTLMGYRHDTTYRLVTGELPDRLSLPPLVLHTLVENGLTHSMNAGEPGTFKLTCDREGDSVRLALTNDGSRLAGMADRGATAIEEGLGLKYVRARLEESFAGRWRLHFGVKDGCWETVIRIPVSIASPDPATAHAGATGQSGTVRG